MQQHGELPAAWSSRRSGGGVRATAHGPVHLVEPDPGPTARDVGDRPSRQPAPPPNPPAHPGTRRKPLGRHAYPFVGRPGPSAASQVGVDRAQEQVPGVRRRRSRVNGLGLWPPLRGRPHRVILRSGRPSERSEGIAGTRVSAGDVRPAFGVAGLHRLDAVPETALSPVRVHALPCHKVEVSPLTTRKTVLTTPASPRRRVGRGHRPPPDWRTDRPSTGAPVPMLSESRSAGTAVPPRPGPGTISRRTSPRQRDERTR